MQYNAENILHIIPTDIHEIFVRYLKNNNLVCKQKTVTKTGIPLYKEDGGIKFKAIRLFQFR
jgi:hypothetical protein